MSLPVYQILVLDPTTADVLLLLDASACYDIRYSRALNDIGILAMTLPSTEGIRDAFVLDSFVEIYRADIRGELQFEETYLTRLTQRFVEGNEERFVVGGVSLNHLLTRRIIDPDDDPLIAGGFSTKSGFAGQVMQQYAEEQIGSLSSVGRSIPTLSIPDPGAYGASVGARLRHENLFKIIQGMSKQGAADFQISRTSGVNFLMDISTIGTDKTRTTNEPLGQPWVGLTPRRGNLTSPSLTADRKQEENFIYALGQGQRDKRIVYKAAGIGVTDSPYNRIEFTEDIRNVEKSDVLALITGAETALKEKQFKNAFVYQPANEEPGNTYREDWDIGDAISVTWDENEFDLRITNAELAISAGGESLMITVTDDFVFPSPPEQIIILHPGTRWTMWHKNSTTTAGGTLTTSIDTNQRTNVATFQSPGAINDTFTNGFYCKAGTYVLSILGITNNAYGIMTVSVDGVVQGTADFYSAGLTYNVIKTVSLTITTDGWHKLTGAALTKNASSSSYILSLSKMWIKQATD